MSALAAFLAAIVATGLLVHLALGLGWVDQRGAQAYRKIHRQPVALVGGAAVLLGVVLALVLGALDEATPWKSLGEQVQRLPWPGLLVAFLLGLADDLAGDGLTARVKFAGQLLVAALVAAQPGEAFASASAIECIALGGLALVAMNAVNLFDHADGLVGTLGSIAMAGGVGPHAGLFAAAIAGYLPFNLKLRKSELEGPVDVGEERAEPAPFAMLGDSGSHLIGVLIATTPGAWWFLLIPTLDMVRVVIGRLRRGAPFWRGDRTHIAHRLQAIGFSGLTTALIVGLTLIPTLVALKLLGGNAPLASGILAGAALYFGILVMTDAVEDSGSIEPLRGGRGASSGGVDDRSDEVSVSDVFARASGRGDGPGSPGGGDQGAPVLRLPGFGRGGAGRDSGAGSSAGTPGPGGPPGGAGAAAEPGEDASGPFAGPRSGLREEDSA